MSSSLLGNGLASIHYRSFSIGLSSLFAVPFLLLLGRNLTSFMGYFASPRLIRKSLFPFPPFISSLNSLPLWHQGVIVRCPLFLLRLTSLRTLPLYLFYFFLHFPFFFFSFFVCGRPCLPHLRLRRPLRPRLHRSLLRPPQPLLRRSLPHQVLPQLLHLNLLLLTSRVIPLKPRVLLL